MLKLLWKHQKAIKTLKGCDSVTQEGEGKTLVTSPIFDPVTSLEAFAYLRVSV